MLAPSSPGQSVASTVELERREALLDEEEDRQTALRTRRFLWVATALFPLLVIIDVAIVAYLEPAPPMPVIAIRALSLLALVGTLAIVSFRYRSGKGLHRLERITTPLLTLLFTAPAVFAGGLSSVYALFVALVLVGRAAMRADPWRFALPSLLSAFTVYPLLLAIAGLAAPRLAAQWHDPAALTALAVYMMANGCVLVVTVVAGHTTYTLRRQLYEARQIGRYQLRRRIGAGGMGEVWAAYFPALRREVAVKIIRGTDVGTIARFEREVRATTELTHPSTIRVFDFGCTDDGLWYYVMELLDGESLGALLAREGPLPPARARHLVLQAARALAEAHKAGIVHRDIKPENLFVTEQGGEGDFIKVLDFGIARVAPEVADSAPTTTGFLQGTPGYIAPEVIRGQRADPRADVYGLGAVAYALLAGSPPFAGKTSIELLEAALDGRIAPPSARRGEPLPPDLEEVVMGCLERDPGRRYPSAAELAAALAACVGVGPWTPAAAPASPPPAAKAEELAETMRSERLG